MLKIASYLKKSRHDVWYFRSVVPVDLRPAFNGRAEIKFSLRTSERKHAVRQSRIISGRVTALYMSLRDAMSRNPKVSDFNIDPDSTIKKIVLHDVDTGNGLRIGHVEADTEEERQFLMRLLQSTDAPAVTPAPAATPAPVPQSGMLLSETMDEFIAKKTPSWAAGTLAVNRATAGLFQEVMAAIMRTKDIRLDMIGLKELEDLVSALQKLPARRTTADLRDKSISSLLAVKNPTWEPVKVSTINSHLGRIEGFWSWAARRGYVKSIDFRDLKIRGMDDDDEGRAPFTIAQLQQIFDAGPYRVSADKPHRFWGPLIALYTGMRIREIIQLHVSDMRQENGVWIFDINSSSPDKQLKNKNSRRHVPIHSKLIELGLLRYRDEMKAAGHEHLFPELPHGTSPHGCGAHLGEFFKEYRRAVGLTGSDTVFHSFRHTVPDAMRAARVDETMISVILGHKRENAGFTAHYGKGHAIDWKKEAVESIAYPELDLSSLTYSSGQFDNAIGKALNKRLSKQAHATAVAARAARTKTTQKSPAKTTNKSSTAPVTTVAPVKSH